MKADEIGYPKSDEIADLPRQAMVLFAAACAERAIHVYREWQGATEEPAKNVIKAVMLAKEYGRGNRARGGYDTRASRELDEVARAVKNASFVARDAHQFDSDTGGYFASYAAEAAYSAATLAHSYSNFSDRFWREGEEAENAACYAIQAHSSGHEAAAIGAAIQADFRSLFETCSDLDA